MDEGLILYGAILRFVWLPSSGIEKSSTSMACRNCFPVLISVHFYLTTLYYPLPATPGARMAQWLGQSDQTGPSVLKMEILLTGRRDQSLDCRGKCPETRNGTCTPVRWAAREIRSSGKTDTCQEILLRFNQILTTSPLKLHSVDQVRIQVFQNQKLPSCFCSIESWQIRNFLQWRITCGLNGLEVN